MTAYLNFFISLLVIMNPIGNLAIYLGLTSGRSQAEINKIPISTAIAIAVILLVSLWVGWPILNFFGISINAFKIAGGIVVLGIGLGMIKEHAKHTKEDMERTSIAIVPLAIPIIAGPGAITVAISYSHDFSILTRLYDSSVCILVAIVFMLILKAAPYIQKITGHKSIEIASKIIGPIVAAIAIQMIAGGVLGFLKPI